MTRLISKLREQGMVGADLSPGDPLAAEAADEIDRLRAALALETQRLDYIENKFHVLGFTRGDTWLKIQPYGTEPKRYGSLREAIDDAMPTDELTGEA